MVQEYKNWGEIFKIEFDIKVTKLPTEAGIKQWVNVFHFTINGDNSQYGDRIPSLFINKNGKFYFFTAISGNKNHEEKFDFELEKLHKIVIQQFQESEKYWYEIIMDGESKVKIENKQQQSFSSVKFYASDPWFEPFSSEFGCIGKITISK